MPPVDQMVLNLPGSMWLLNVILGLIMFGVALDLHLDDFKRVLKSPKGPAIGLVCQFLVLPALTFLLIELIEPAPSIALGMVVVACCPGGNISNFTTHLAGGNTALSISMTAVSTAVSVILTPVNIAFWGGASSVTSGLLQEVHLDPMQMMATVTVILGIPLVVGMLIEARRPRVAAFFRKPLKYFSIGFFVAFILIAFQQNVDNFLKYVGLIMIVVALQNGLALFGAYGIARAFKETEQDARAIGIEVGMQNSALGLTLIFTFFNGLGGMAIVAAWWGIWHLVSGLGVAGVWSTMDRLAVARQRAGSRTAA
ncbi:MAG: bile acid:sodium symporter family protein [Deltaproteobacteria bacterium]|nr:bile acid:sodium symporter family protein [Deltaproteobacteria bacterium]